MLVSLSFWTLLRKKEISDYKLIASITVPLIMGILIRCLLVIPLNYFYAIPIWTGMTTAQAMAVIPWYIIVIFNGIQGILDIVLAWIVVFRFRLDRFASWYR
jgi:riboflavin transporter FmnP